MPVSIHLSPSSGEVQYLALKRTVALGTVLENNYSGNKIVMENGSAYVVIPGSPVMRDQEISGLEAVKAGDHVSLVLLPDTNEAIGLVAFSSISYGKVIDFSKNNRTVYFLDDSGRYRSLYLPPDAVIYRWGVRFTADAIAAGNRIRITTDPEQKTIWQLDIADLFFEQDIFLEYDGASGIISMAKSGKYRVSNSTRFYKNSLNIQPEDFRAGEQVELEYTTAPSPTGNVLISVNCLNAAKQPGLLVSAVPLRGSYIVSGITSAGSTKVYTGLSRQPVPVDDSGRFTLEAPVKSEDYILKITAVDERTGGVTDIEAVLAGVLRDDYNEYITSAILKVREIINDAPLTRAEAAAVLARTLNWPDAGTWTIPFSDAGDIPASFRSAVAGAHARNIFKGYPDGSFLPAAAMSRAEAAVFLSGVMDHLGLDVENNSRAQYYSDAAGIPSWAATSVASTTAAGLFRDWAGGAFAPAEPVTYGEMRTAIVRLLEYYETRFKKAGLKSPA